jgi:ribulose kinase
MLTATPEAVAQGAAALAGLAAGVYADAGASVAAMAQIADTIRPEPGAVALYEGLYRAWLAVDDRYAGVFQPGG